MNDAQTTGLRYCLDFPEAPSCCDSCHDDDSLGYPMCEFDHAYVCCVVMRWCDEAGIDLDRNGE